MSSSLPAPLPQDPANSQNIPDPDIDDATHDVEDGTQTLEDGAIFDDTNEDEEQAPPNKPWIAATIVIAVAILCVVVILILMYIGHLQPLTTGNKPTEDNQLKPINPAAAGTGAKLSTNIKSLLGSPSHDADKKSHHKSSSHHHSKLSGSVKKVYSAVDALSRSPVDNDKNDDAPGLAAFMGLKFHHKGEPHVHPTDEYD